MAGYPCPSIIPTDWFARCFLRSRTSRQEFAAEIDGSNVAASVCGFPELVGDRSNQRLRAVPRELRSSACVSRCACDPRRQRGVRDLLIRHGRRNSINTRKLILDTNITYTKTT